MWTTVILHSIVDAKVVKTGESTVGSELLHERKGKIHISEVSYLHVESTEKILKRGNGHLYNIKGRKLSTS